jgi:tripartite-type tricarboxylate transporter receptor subunit TctC
MFMMNQKTLMNLLRCISFVSLGVTMSQPLMAQQTPLTLVVGYAAGGAMDIQVRALAQVVREQTGRDVVVVNRAGASGSIATDAVANEPPDGNTLLVHDAYFNSARSASLVPLIQMSETAFGIWERPNRSSKTGVFAFGGANAGYGFLYGNLEALGRWAGSPATPTPYRGVTPALTDTVNGHADYFVGALSSLQAATQQGLKLVAVSSANVAQSLGVAALGKAIPNLKELTIPVGVYAPNGVNEKTISALQETLFKAINQKSFIELLAKNQYVLCGCTPGSLQTRVNEFANLAQLAVAQGIDLSAPFLLKGNYPASSGSLVAQAPAVSVQAPNVMSATLSAAISAAATPPVVPPPLPSPPSASARVYGSPAIETAPASTSVAPLAAPITNNLNAECSQLESRIYTKAKDDTQALVATGSMAGMLRVQLQRAISIRDLYSANCAAATNATAKRNMAQQHIAQNQAYCQQWGMGGQCAAPPVLAAPTRPSAASSATSSASGTAHCMGKLEVERDRLEKIRLSSRNDDIAGLKVLIQSNQYQVDLFSGECAAHPEAATYVAAGKKGVGEWRDACQQKSGNANCDPAPSAAASNTAASVGTSNTRASNNANNSASGAETAIEWAGDMTQLCIVFKARPRSRDSTIQWYDMTNRCNEVIMLHISDGPTAYYGSAMELRPNQTDSSWWAIKNRSDINFIACRDKTINDEKVHFDHKQLGCYFRRKLYN